MRKLEHRIQRAEKASEAQESWTVDIGWLSDAEYSDLLRGTPAPGEDPREDEHTALASRLMNIAIAREICHRKGFDFDRARFDNMNDEDLWAFCEHHSEFTEHGKMRLK